MSSASDAVVEDTWFVGDGFLALRAFGCAGLGNRHTGQGFLSYQSSFPFQLTLLVLYIFAKNRKAHSHLCDANQPF